MTAREWLRWRWAQLAYNWFTLGFICATRGHDMRGGRWYGVDIHHCQRCGQYGGLNLPEPEDLERAAKIIRHVRSMRRTDEEVARYMASIKRNEESR